MPLVTDSNFRLSLSLFFWLCGWGKGGWQHLILLSGSGAAECCVERNGMENWVGGGTGGGLYTLKLCPVRLGFYDREMDGWMGSMGCLCNEFPKWKKCGQWQFRWLCQVLEYRIMIIFWVIGCAMLACLLSVYLPGFFFIFTTVEARYSTSFRETGLFLTVLREVTRSCISLIRFTTIQLGKISTAKRAVLY